MIYGVYTIRDNVSNGTNGLRLYVNDKVAIRDFKASVVVNQEDFDLLCCGKYDLQTGIITASSNPIVVLKGISLINKDGE